MKRYTESITSVDLKPKGYHLKQMSECPEAINKLGKLEDLEEEIGCSLLVIEKALTNGIYIKGEEGLCVVNRHVNMLIVDQYSAVWIKDYKKTWWLKESKEE